MAPLKSSMCARRLKGAARSKLAQPLANVVIAVRRVVICCNQQTAFARPQQQQRRKSTHAHTQNEDGAQLVAFSDVILGGSRKKASCARNSSSCRWQKSVIVFTQLRVRRQLKLKIILSSCKRSAESQLRSQTESIAPESEFLLQEN